MVRPARGAITLRQLLSHTAGNSYHFWNADIKRYQEETGIPGIAECREATLRTPLVFDPGTGWEYGMNADWVGKAIEEVTGAGLDDYLRDNLLGPLGMRDTGFVLTPARRARLSGLSFRTLEGLVPVDFEVNQEPEFQMGGGGLYGTPADYLTFTRMLLGGGIVDGVRVLREETVVEAMRNQIGDFPVGAFISADPASSFDVEFLPGITKKWGLLGLLNVAETPSGRSAGSLFWAGLPNCYFWVDRYGGSTGVFFTQVMPFADPDVLGLFDRFESAVHLG
jgi:CubicO group peptidase (beta-lactamase class C family)